MDGMPRNLPINKLPSINTYADLAYINAILESSEVLRIYVDNFANDEWNFEDAESAIIEDGRIIITAFVEDKDIKGKIKRKGRENDEIVVYIEYFRKLDNFAYLELYCSFFQSSDKLAMTNYGFYKDNRSIEYAKRYYWIKLKKRGGLIEYYASENGVEWDMISSSCLFIEDEEVTIGIEYSLGSKQLCAWNSMNYLQLCLDLNDVYGARWLDYYMFPRKDYDHLYGVYSYFFDVEYFKYYEILEVWGNLDKFVKYCLNRGYYLLIRLDEYYLPGRKAYNEYHYEHDNLIYGYDNREYYLLGYNEKVTDSRVKNDGLDDICYKNKKIVRYRLATNECRYTFDLDGFLQTLKEFIYGIDSSKKYSNTLTQSTCIYGLKVFEAFLNDNRANELLLTDKRIPYLLSEHCEIMMRRLEFLIAEGYIKKKRNIDMLRVKCKEMNEQGKILLWVFLKNRITNKGKDNVMKNLIKLYELEKDFYGDLYDVIVNK